MPDDHRQPDRRGVAAATNGSAQEIAGISRADAVLAVTDGEAVNLEIALVAKDVNPSVRVVARVFDHDLASRVERWLQLGATRSVSMLAAPAFASAALGRQRDLSGRAPSAAVDGMDGECELGGAGPLTPAARGARREPDPRLESLFRHKLAVGTS
jgi:hypothetical protein